MSIRTCFCLILLTLFSLLLLGACSSSSNKGDTTTDASVVVDTHDGGADSVVDTTTMVDGIEDTAQVGDLPGGQDTLVDDQSDQLDTPTDSGPTDLGPPDMTEEDSGTGDLGGADLAQPDTAQPDSNTSDVAACVDDDKGKDENGAKTMTPITAEVSYKQLQLCPSQPTDWFKITLSGPQELVIIVQAQTAVCSDVEMVSENGTQSVKGTTPGLTNADFQLQAGTYYLKVSMHECGGAQLDTGTYDLQVNFGCGGSDQTCKDSTNGLRPYCVNSKCVECTAATQATDCATHPNGTICLENQGGRCGCDNDGHCAASSYGTSCAQVKVCSCGSIADCPNSENWICEQFAQGVPFQICKPK